MKPIIAEVIPNELPFRNSFWSQECVFCQEVFTLASFVTMTFAIVLGVLAMVAFMYWLNKDEPVHYQKRIKGRTRYPTTS